MARWIVGTLSCLALGTLSCHVPWAETPVAVATPPALDGRAVVDDTPPPEPARAAVISYLESHRSGLTDDEIRDVAGTIVREARRHGLDPQLVLAVIHIESRGNAFALSPVGAMGMMQIMPATGAELAETLSEPWEGPGSLFDPHLNVKLGVAYLRQLTDRYDSLPTALAAYNWGPGRIDQKLRRGSPVPAGYSQSVLAAYPPEAAPRSRVAGT